ncbi:MAG: cytochrome-c peroxidase [Epsilonproteobacteria bacterium]|nr:cytochrome-c peroxidase [Campylobacterota bacterium]
MGLSLFPKDYPALLKTLKTNEAYLSKEKISLGKKLFFDKNLSLNRDISCASCHDFQKGGVDGRPTAIGHKSQANPHHLNTPTVLNTALSTNLFWDGKATTLQEQAKGPLQASFEMSATPELIEKRVNESSIYLKKFVDVYGEDAISFNNTVDAIEAYEKTLLTRSKFDEFLEGDTNALNEKEKKGLQVFMKNGCVLCHSGTGLGGQMLRKFPLVRHSAWSKLGLEKAKQLMKHYQTIMETNPTISYQQLTKQLGVQQTKALEENFFSFYNKPEQENILTTTGCYSCHNRGGDYQISIKHQKKIAYPFSNKGEFLGKDERYFRVPILRNITSTEPYFHNGETKELEDVIKIMSKYQLVNELSDEKVEQIIDFLKTLDGELVDYGVE